MPRRPDWKAPTEENDAPREDGRTVVSLTPTREQPSAMPREREPDKKRREPGQRERPAVERKSDLATVLEEGTTSVGSPPDLETPLTDRTRPEPKPLGLDRTVPSAAALRRDPDLDVVGAPERTVVAPMPRATDDEDDLSEVKLTGRKHLNPDLPARRLTEPWVHIRSGFRDIGRGSVAALRVGFFKLVPPERWDAFKRALALAWIRVADLGRRGWATTREAAQTGWETVRAGVGKSRQSASSDDSPRIYEDAPKDTADRGKAREFERFRKGKTSSSYLQDEEPQTKPDRKR